MLTYLFEDATLSPPPNLYKCFQLWKSIDLDSAWVRNSRPYELSLLSSVLARLGMHYAHVLGAEIPTNAYLTF